MKRRAGLFIGTVLAVLALATASVGASGFTDSAPTVTCSTVSIDPAYWVSVTFMGDLTGHPGFSVTVPYGAENPHMAIAHIEGWHLQGHIVGDVVATGNFGPYGVHTSKVAHVDIECGDPPTTTTSTTIAVPVVKQPTPTTSVEIGTAITVSAPASAVLVQPKFTG